MPRPSQSRPTAVEVRSPARLHLGMLSFGNPALRSFGGVGIMVDRPGVQLRMRRANRFEARGPQSERAIEFAAVCAKAWNLGTAACSIEVVAAPPAHAGLGSGTQLALSVAAGMSQLFVRDAAADLPAPPEHPMQPDLEPSEHELSFDTRESLDFARATGRGRRSCVGVHGFSRGGLIIEAGRRVPAGAAACDDADREFAPMVARVRLPSAWRCVVIVGRDAVGLHGAEESAAFTGLPPMDTAVSAELARIALLEMLPAAVESRFAEFAAAVGAYGRLAGRPFADLSRRLPHAEATTHLLELLVELGVPGCAQSSWGPTVMACCESLEAAGVLVEHLERLQLARHHELVIARFDSQGATLRMLE
jgi:predicted sugar kinase